MGELARPYKDNMGWYSVDEEKRYHVQGWCDRTPLGMKALDTGRWVWEKYGPGNGSSVPVKCQEIQPMGLARLHKYTMDVLALYTLLLGSNLEMVSQKQSS